MFNVALYQSLIACIYVYKGLRIQVHVHVHINIESIDASSYSNFGELVMSLTFV